MYSRYTPGPDGAYRRQSIPPAPPQMPPTEQKSLAPLPAASPPVSLKQRLGAFLPGDMELEDLLVLLVAILLLIDSEEDLQIVLVTLAAYFFL